ncbi:MAG: cyclic nucleotide-binding domain-containing protein [Thermoanaerobaculia bacterium]|nr:cyclic nucleotide-binding domain-containing protein [Thermoanaerobaculia bacterium]
MLDSRLEDLDNTTNPMDEIAPSSPIELDELTHLAKRFVEGKLYDQAIQLFELALALDPKNMGVQLGLAQVKRLARGTNKPTPRLVRDSVREQIRRNALDAKHFLGLAYLYRDRGDEARAEEYLEISAAKDLPNPAPHKLYARMLFHRREYSRALVQLLKARRYNPFDRQVAVLIGRSRHELGDFEGALAAFIDAFLLLPESDREEAGKLRTWIQDLRDALEWDNDQLTALFHRRREELRIMFDRLEWHRERYHETARLSHQERQLTRGDGRIDMAARLRQFDPWNHLSDEQLFLLTAAAHEEEFHRGEEVFAHGTLGSDIYILEKGEITIQRNTPYGVYPLGILKTGEIFGEVNFITPAERTGDAVAAQNCQLIRFDAEQLRRVLENNPKLGVQVYWSFWHNLAFKLRCTNEQLKTFFADERASQELRRQRAAGASGQHVAVDSEAKVRLFQEQGLSANELLALSRFATERTYAADEILFNEGDPGTEMFIVVHGKIRISKFIPGGGEEALTILERGGFFGEMALIDGQPRSADARAHHGPATVIALEESTIRDVLAVDPAASLEFLQLLCRLIAERLRQIDDKIVSWRIMSGQSH